MLNPSRPVKRLVDGKLKGEELNKKNEIRKMLNNS